MSKAVFECSICCDDVSIDFTVKCIVCKKLVCRPCTKVITDQGARNGTSIKCPFCRSQFHISLLISVIQEMDWRFCEDRFSKAEMKENYQKLKAWLSYIRKVDKSENEKKEIDELKTTHLEMLKMFKIVVENKTVRGQNKQKVGRPKST